MADRTPLENKQLTIKNLRIGDVLYVESLVPHGYPRCEMTKKIKPCHEGSYPHTFHVAFPPNVSEVLIEVEPEHKHTQRFSQIVTLNKYGDTELTVDRTVYEKDFRGIYGNTYSASTGLINPVGDPSEVYLCPEMLELKNKLKGT